MNVLEQHLSKNFIKTHALDPNQVYTIRQIPAKELLVPERFDLSAKLAYIEAKVTGSDLEYAKELYSKHLEAFSEGSFAEPGDNSKTTLERYYEVFDGLIETIGKNGFDAEQSWIPVGKNNIILDGAHRTACAIYFDLPVTIIEFPNFEVCFDYQYFRNRRLSETLQQEMAIIYSHYVKAQLFCACLWPIAKNAGHQVAEDYIRQHARVLYAGEVSLEYTGLRNFMLQIYGHQDWVGSLENHFSGLSGKVDACYYPGVKTGVVLFMAKDLGETLQIKSQIRSLLKLDKHALHISDDICETALMASLLLNENSIHALNYGKPDSSPTFFGSLHAVPQGKLLSPEATLAYYGLQDSGAKSTGALSLNPRNYFSFSGYLFPSLKLTRNLCPNYQEQIDTLIASTSYSDGDAKRCREYRAIARQWQKEKRILYMKQLMAKCANKLGLYTLLHKIHNTIRR